MILSKATQGAFSDHLLLGAARAVIGTCVLGGVLFLACADAAVDLDPLVSVSMFALRDAPESLALKGRSLALVVEVSRDFMPIAVLSDAEGSVASADRSAIGVSIQVQDGNQQPMPHGLRVDHAWLLQGEKIWETIPLDEPAESDSVNTIKVYLRGGPTWEPHSFVDLVVRLIDDQGVAYLLAKRHQQIEATV